MPIALKHVSDMPKNTAGKPVISGTFWDYNATQLEQKFNAGITGADVTTDPTAGLTDANVATGANIQGGKLAVATVTDRELGYQAIMNTLMFWMLR